jgi:hypothetical protein
MSLVVAGQREHMVREVSTDSDEGAALLTAITTYGTRMPGSKTRIPNEVQAPLSAWRAAEETRISGLYETATSAHDTAVAEIVSLKAQIVTAEGARDTQRVRASELSEACWALRNLTDVDLVTIVSASGGS